MKSILSPKGRKGSSGEHPVDRAFGRLNLEKPVDTFLDEMRGPGQEEVKTAVDSSVSPPRPGDLFLQVFGPDRGASLELPRQEPHEPIDLE